MLDSRGQWQARSQRHPELIPRRSKLRAEGTLRPMELFSLEARRLGSQGQRQPPSHHSGVLDHVAREQVAA